MSLPTIDGFRFVLVPVDAKAGASFVESYAVNHLNEVDSVPALGAASEAVKAAVIAHVE